jgi:cytoskeletal protein CcmA (bactofilin family)
MFNRRKSEGESLNQDRSPLEAPKPATSAGPLGLDPLPKADEPLAPARPQMPKRAVDLSAAPSRPAESKSAPAPEPASGEKKQLIVGRGIRLQGEITACDLLVVEGEVEAKLNRTKAVQISEGGTFKGDAEIEEAEIGGVFEGSLVARKRLVVRATGQVTGDVRYGEIEVERGGRLSGKLASLSEGGARSTNEDRVSESSSLSDRAFARVD